jgi:hypothetical protein
MCSALNHRFKFKKNYQCGKILRQDRDFSTLDAVKRQFEERWRRENSVIYMGLISGPNKADDICGKTTVTGTMDRGFTVYTEEKKIKEINL